LFIFLINTKTSCKLFCWPAARYYPQPISSSVHHTEDSQWDKWISRARTTHFATVSFIYRTNSYAESQTPLYEGI